MEVIKFKMSQMESYSQFLEQSAFLITLTFAWRKSEPRFRKNEENSSPKKAQPQLYKLIIAYLMTFSQVFIVIDIY